MHVINKHALFKRLQKVYISQEHYGKIYTKFSTKILNSVMQFFLLTFKIELSLKIKVPNSIKIECKRELKCILKLLMLYAWFLKAPIFLLTHFFISFLVVYKITDFNKGRNSIKFS